MIKSFLSFSRNIWNPVISVLPIREISLWPELSSPPRFRIQGGYHKRYGRKEKEPVRKSLCLILDAAKLNLLEKLSFYFFHSTGPLVHNAQTSLPWFLKRREIENIKKNKKITFFLFNVLKKKKCCKQVKITKIFKNLENFKRCKKIQKYQNY